MEIETTIRAMSFRETKNLADFMIKVSEILSEGGLEVKPHEIFMALNADQIINAIVQKKILKEELWRNGDSLNQPSIRGDAGTTEEKKETGEESPPAYDQGS